MNPPTPPGLEIASAIFVDVFEARSESGREGGRGDEGGGGGEGD